ncbi:hypothetical protein ASPBRDRAFT_210604 [Aspergillus brasiliensis CBS 101740]|uniref:Uncharacterized protein n=1 Tax=Aspergillus brasiliensis (strain CBS 101740 / IMI 381727 / IBT 21946) TaxID=767769 RepID=A0A1L9U7R1_ASPBC|nr:hypothetical protein ASPBRDRAFT_210604 [Aspergillus brasiliensis CBS 101740]
MTSNEHHEESGQLGPVPVPIDTLKDFYLDVLHKMEEKYHKLPKALAVNLTFKESSGEDRFGLEFLLSATDETTAEQRTTTFSTIIHTMTAEPRFEGLSLDIRVKCITV